jgi:hypothetical protein
MEARARVCKRVYPPHRWFCRGQMGLEDGL